MPALRGSSSIVPPLRGSRVEFRSELVLYPCQLNRTIEALAEHLSRNPTLVHPGDSDRPRVAGSRVTQSPAGRSCRVCGEHPLACDEQQPLLPRQLPLAHQNYGFKLLSSPSSIAHRGLLLINAASSTGRCNTIQSVDPPILPLKKRSVWLLWSKPSQGNVPAALS